MPNPRKSAEPSELDFGFNKNIQLITNLVALLLVKGESQSEQIRMLTAAGYTSTQVALLLGLNSTTVRTTLHRLRAAKK